MEDSDSLHRAVAACKPDAVMHLAGKKGGNGYNPERCGRGMRREAVGRSRDWNKGVGALHGVGARRPVTDLSHP